MLDRSKLLQELQKISDKLFLDFSSEHRTAQEAFKRIALDPLFSFKAQAAHLPMAVPSWQGQIDASFPVLDTCNSYRILSVDGSQIYPDRHQGVSCYLINIGTVALSYGISGRNVIMQSIPYAFTGEEQKQYDESAIELVNCKREELEFIAGLQASRVMKDQNLGCPELFLFDGSLIFWHLDAKDPEVKQVYLSSYLTVLQKLYEEKILVAGYVSMPRSRELTNLIKFELSKTLGDNAEEAVDHVLDAHIVSWFLQSSERTTIFKNHAKISENYPDHLSPYFFYLHNGDEIGRVEIPAWIAHDDAAVETIATLIMDQCRKGRGYPVVLAEAHEQAVVKGPDREFFYQLICKLGVEHKQRFKVSQKSLKKRGMSI